MWEDEVAKQLNLARIPRTPNQWKTSIYDVLIAWLIPNHQWRALDLVRESSTVKENDEGEEVVFSENRSQDFKATSNKTTTLKRRRPLITIIFGLFLSCVCAEARDIQVTINSTHINPPSFEVREGDEICLSEDFGGRISIYLTALTRRTKYELEYYTRDFDTYLTAPKPESNYCKNMNESEEAGKLNQSFDVITDYKCQYKCDELFSVTCAHEKKRKPRGNLFEVWRKVWEQRKLTVNISGPDNWQVATFSENDPLLVDLSKFKLQGVTGWALVSTNATSPLSQRSLLKYDDEFYFIKSAEFGDPKDGKFGDFQVSLNKSVTKTAEPLLGDIDCHLSSSGSSYYSCDCKFRRKKSMIGSFVLRKDEYRKAKRVIHSRTDNATVEVIESNIKDSNLTLMHLPASFLHRKSNATKREATELQHGICDIVNINILFLDDEVLGNTTLVLMTVNITSPGWMRFISNCSFNTGLINCGTDKFNYLQSVETSGICLIEIPSMEKSFILPLLQTANLQIKTAEYKGSYNHLYGSVHGACEVTPMEPWWLNNGSASVVFRALNIQKRGLMPFQSNCSFNRRAFRCEEHAETELLALDVPNTCLIRVPSGQEYTLYFGNSSSKLHPNQEI